MFVFDRELHGIAGGAPARQNCNFMNRIGIRKHAADQGMSAFMISRDFLFLVGQNMAFALRPEHNLFYGFPKLFIADLGLVLAGGQYSGFIKQVGQVGPAESGSTFGYPA